MILIRRIIYFSILLTMTSIVRIVSSQSYIYLEDKSMAEEMPVTTLVSNLRKEVEAKNLLSSPLSLNEEQFTLLEDSKLSRGNVFFKLDSNTGELTTNQFIDREAMCMNRLCADPCDSNQLSQESLNGSCRINLKVLMLPSSNILNFNVFIEDINDNRPLFRSHSLIKSINENVPVGYKLPVELAYDPDIGQNRVQFYELITDSEIVRNTFGLSQSLNEGRLHLVVIGELDREKIATYKFVIAAYDGGKPSLRSDINVTVDITDINDNNPVFEKSLYKFSVSEDLSVDSKIGRLTATDKDIGLNGLIKYSFVDKSAGVGGMMKKINTAKNFQYFDLDEQTGIIRLKKPLNYEETNSYVFTVEARDSGVGSLPGLTTVEITVIDINDNQPHISVSFLNSLHKNSTDGRKYDLYLPENTQTNKFLAHVNINDPDSELNGKLDWKILLDQKVFANSSTPDNPRHQANSILKLTRLNQNSFTINVGNSRLLDRETNLKHEVSIVAWDYGQPQLQPTFFNFTIVITDENDHPPQFERSVYQISIYENQPPYMILFKVKATDEDATKPNSIVRYSIREESARKFLDIDPNLGVIQTKSSFDRESMDILVFHVVASDEGEPGLSSSARVVLSILDKNDHVPVIHYNTSFYHFFDKNVLNVRVSQLLDIDSQIIDFSGVDKDLGDNSKVEFYIFGNEKISDQQRLPFHLSTTGKLILSRNLGRMNQDMFVFKVLCKDLSTESLNSTLTVRIEITNTQEFCIETHNNDLVTKFINRDILLSNEKQTSGQTNLFESEVSLKNSLGSVLDVELLTCRDLVDVKVHNRSSGWDNKVNLVVSLKSGLNISRLIIGKYLVQVKLVNQQMKSCGRIEKFNLLIGNNFMNEKEIMTYIDDNAADDDTSTISFKAITKSAYKVKPATLLIKSDYILLVILIVIILITAVFLTFIGVICFCNRVKREYSQSKKKKAMYTLNRPRDEDFSSTDIEIMSNKKIKKKMRTKKSARDDLNTSSTSGGSNDSSKPQYLLVNNSSSSRSSTSNNTNGTLIYRDPEFDEFGLNPSTIQLVRQKGHYQSKQNKNQKYLYSSTIGGGKNEVNVLNIYDISNTDRSSNSATNSIVESTTVEDTKSTSSNNDFEVISPLNSVVKANHLMVRTPKFQSYRLNANEPSLLYSTISDCNNEQAKNLACQETVSPTGSNKLSTFNRTGNRSVTSDTIHAATIINNVPRNASESTYGIRSNIRTSFNL